MTTIAQQFTSLYEIEKIHAQAQQAFRAGKAMSIAFRKQQISQLGYLIKDNEERFKEALMHDLRRPALETEFLEFAQVYHDVAKAYNAIEKWTAPTRAEFDLNWWFMGPKHKAEPKGVALIISPFNCPVMLALSPLVGAIAGGNAAVIKPSEQAPALSALLAELVPKYLDPELYHVILCGVPEVTKACTIYSQIVARLTFIHSQVLELRWDHRNGRIARIIAAAASKHLTPLTLEVWKNPVVIDPKVDLKFAARRIFWGRCLGAGQICVAPEYILVPFNIQDDLVDAIKDVYHSFFPDGPEKSDSLGRIVSEAHTRRIKNLIDHTRGTIVFGGEADVSRKYVSPTLVKDVPEDDSLMSEEIFGPVLLIIPVKDVDQAIEFINERDDPLVVHVFSKDKAFQGKVFSNTRSGSCVANETMIVVGANGLPMGGTGASGYGYFTGKDMFDQFTHKRASIDNPGWVDKVGFSCRYPPYKSLKPMMALAPSLPPRVGTHRRSWRWVIWLLLAAMAAGVRLRAEKLGVKMIPL
uniref:Aldehyde dehydrogenase n=1 Tax=Ganoderma boninense TaxID=34458 RepID=A0A5K1K201_9APHY|nr:Trihydroxynaphthalene reductase (EC (T3HN reductase) [Ganoderma boninense]